MSAVVRRETCYECGEDVIGDRCSHCSMAHPLCLEVEAEYRLVSCKHDRKVPVMPWVNPPKWYLSLPLSAARLAVKTRMTYLKAGHLFIPEKRVERGSASSGPWYLVFATGRGFAAKGWVNAQALIGWSLERV